MAELIPGVSLRKTVILVDTNVVIEAVRTGTWNALTGAAKVETVEECRDEMRRGDDGTRPGYVAVSATDLHRLSAVHAVSQRERAEYLLVDPDAVAMDPGEQDLFAHVYQRAKAGDDVWVLCSSDKAAIRAAVRIAIADQLTSLEAACAATGARPKQPLKTQHKELFLSKYRTEYLLGG